MYQKIFTTVPRKLPSVPDAAKTRLDANNKEITILETEIKNYIHTEIKKYIYSALFTEIDKYEKRKEYFTELYRDKPIANTISTKIYNTIQPVSKKYLFCYDFKNFSFTDIENFVKEDPILVYKSQILDAFMSCISDFLKPEDRKSKLDHNANFGVHNVFHALTVNLLSITDADNVSTNIETYRNTLNSELYRLGTGEPTSHLIDAIKLFLNNENEDELDTTEFLKTYSSDDGKLNYIKYILKL